MLGLASTLDAEGKAAEAIDQYEKVRKRFPTDSVVDEAKLALARLYEKQNLGEAYKLYTELASAGQQSGIGSEAGIRLADLMEKYPEFAKTNAPPAPVAPTTTIPPQTTIARITPTNPVMMSVTNTNAAATGAPPSKTTSPLLIKPTVPPGT